MIFKNIIVRADFVDGDLVPRCFQVAPNEPLINIGRIYSSINRISDNRIEYKFRIANNDKMAILILDTSGGSYNWSVDMEWDIERKERR